MSCDGADKLAVIPVDKPTVAKADMTSKVTWSAVNSGSQTRSVATPTATTIIPAAVSARAWRKVDSGRRRCPMEVSSRPKNSEIIAAPRTHVVVTLMPPAVPADPPPINIKMSVTISVNGCASP